MERFPNPAKRPCILQWWFLTLLCRAYIRVDICRYLSTLTMSLCLQKSKIQENTHKTEKTHKQTGRWSKKRYLAQLQPPINRDSNGVNRRRGFCRNYATLFCAESLKYRYIWQYLETWREPGPAQAGFTIAEQSRINREPIADFIDTFGKLNWSGLLDFELVVLIPLCYWLSLLSTVSRQARIQYK